MSTIVFSAKTYLNYCKNQKRLSYNTIRAYNIDMRQFIDFLRSKGFDGLNAVDITKEILKDFVEQMQLRYAVKTCKRKIACVKAFFSHLEEEDIIPINPFRKLHLKLCETRKLPKTIKKRDVVHQLKYVYQMAEKAVTPYQKYYAARAIACYEILLNTGMRIGEVCNLLNDAIDLEAKCIRIVGKGNKERIAYLTGSSVMIALQNYIAIKDQCRVSSHFFFSTTQGKRMSEESARHLIRRVGKETIGKRITPHMFRHTFASTLLELNVDIRYIQELLGHSSINTTQIYLHLLNTAIRNSLERANLRQQFMFIEQKSSICC